MFRVDIIHIGQKSQPSLGLSEVDVFTFDYFNNWSIGGYNFSPRLYSMLDLFRYKACDRYKPIYSCVIVSNMPKLNRIFHKEAFSCSVVS